jgi:hypothetical protein
MPLSRHISCIFHGNGNTNTDTALNVFVYLTVEDKGSVKWEAPIKSSFKSQIAVKNLPPIYKSTKHAKQIEVDVGFGPEQLNFHEKFFDPQEGYFRDGKFAINCVVSS